MGNILFDKYIDIFLLLLLFVVKSIQSYNYSKHSLFHSISLLLLLLGDDHKGISNSPLASYGGEKNETMHKIK